VQTARNSDENSKKNQRTMQEIQTKAQAQGEVDPGSTGKQQRPLD
jgi:hypothetical protein